MAAALVPAKKFDGAFQIPMLHTNWTSGAVLRVRVDNLITPWKFSMQLEEKIPAAMFLEQKLTEYLTLPWVERERRMDSVTGAWNYDEQFFSVWNMATGRFGRCNLISEPEFGVDRRTAKRGSVFFIDHGNFQTVTSLHELRQMDFSFCRLPAISVLGKCPNAPTNEKEKWSYEMIDEFRNLVEDKTCSVEVLEIQQNSPNSVPVVTVKFNNSVVKPDKDDDDLSLTTFSCQDDESTKFCFSSGSDSETDETESVHTEYTTSVAFSEL